MISYHVTLGKSVPNILARGLQPRIGPRSKELGEVERAVFMYKSRRDCKEGLAGWFGGVFFNDEISDMVVLELDIGKDVLTRKENEGEIFVLELIAPNSVKRIWSKDFSEDLTNKFEAAVIVLPQPIEESIPDSDFF